MGWLSLEPWVLWGALAGGVTLFVWNAVVWMAIRWHNSEFRAVPKPAPVEDAIRGLSSGMYNLPHPSQFAKGFEDPAFAERWKTGPNAMLIVTAPGPCMDGGTFVRAYVLNVLEALGAAIAVHAARASVVGLLPTVTLTAILGLLVHGGPQVSLALWMRFPRAYAAKAVVDGLVGFALVGVVFHLLR